MISACAVVGTISIHSPRMGRDLAVGKIAAEEIQFQSTLPAWGETCRSSPDFSSAAFQSTLPAWGETCFAPVGLHGLLISIHSPRMGRDPLVLVGR